MSSVSEITQSFFSSAVEFIEPPFIAVRNFVTPTLKLVAEKIHNIWTDLLPYLESTAQFLGSPLGISLELFGLSILPLQLSRTGNDTIISVALLAAGILIAGAGGFLLCVSRML
jgi:hypothetical protein